MLEANAVIPVVDRVRYCVSVSEHAAMLENSQRLVRENSHQRTARESLALTMPIELVPLELAIVNFIGHTSKHHKLEYAKQIFFHGDRSRSHRIAWDNATLPEEKFNRLPMMISTAEIAATKASRVFDETSISQLVSQIQEYITLVQSVTELEIVEKYGLHVLRALENNPIVNKVGERPLSISGDTIVWWVNPENSEHVILHQPKQLLTKDDHYNNLRKLFRLEQKQQFTMYHLQDTQAVDDPLFCVGALVTRDIDIVFKGMDEQTLLAFVYGLQDPRVTFATRERFLSTLQKYPDWEKENLFKGYSITHGMDPKVLSNISGGIPQQCPFFYPYIDSLGGVRREDGDFLFALQLDLLQKIASGHATQLNTIVRGLLQYTKDPSQFQDKVSKERSEHFRRVAGEVNEHFGKQVMREHWIDLTPCVQDIQPSEDYIMWLASRILTENVVGLSVEDHNRQVDKLWN